ncbi:chorion class A protein L12-like [Bombyx mandarina]|uniref:Chorion class A protein L12-like n=1 Tax=Bombyx mandarina TaxID=7092 RepID=A0A6J2JJM6_BOMMA|nr:chorion class A protein L12-like [Bombyx mandarina]
MSVFTLLLCIQASLLQYVDTGLGGCDPGAGLGVHRLGYGAAWHGLGDGWNGIHARYGGEVIGSTGVSGDLSVASATPVTGRVSITSAVGSGDPTCSAATTSMCGRCAPTSGCRHAALAGYY